MRKERQQERRRCGDPKRSRRSQCDQALPWPVSSATSQLIRASEGKLVSLWTSAAVHIRHTDIDLAERLLMKANYWTNPEHWSAEEVSENGIEIETISKEGERLLTKWRSPT